MLTLIRRARRRLLYNELLAQGSIAVSAALIAWILLLLIGTEVLDWYWVLLIPAAAMVVAGYRVRRRLPALYQSAQIIDRRLDLADSLSTAVYFNGDPAFPPSPEFRRLQSQQAERMAAGVDVRRAVPYQLPRAAYVMAGLILLAGSLFALRYGLTRRLDLSQPMARILQQALGWDTPQSASLPQRKEPRASDSGPQDGDSPLASDQPQNDPNAQAGDPLEDEQDSQNAKADGKKADKNAKNQDDKGDNGSGDDQGQGEQRASDDQNSGRPSDSDKQNQQAGGQDPNSSSNSSSLLSKMKEAMQNLLSSMKQQPSGSNSQQAQPQNPSAQNGKQNGQKNAGKQSQKGEKTSGQAGGEEQDPDLTSESQQAENAPGQGDDARPSNKQPGSGAGNRDGSKDVKAAEQLAAMGKIAQIIGKRSATLSGEATVEVQSTAQQLRTAYSDRTAQHTDAGGDIGRDEIPVALESYVQQYFEQLRKQPAPKK